MKTLNKPIMVQNGLTEAQHYSFSMRTLQKNVPLHWHGYYELELVINGTGKQIINGVPVPIAKGSLTFLAPFDCHSIEIGEEITLLNCSFKDTFLSDDSMRIDLLKKSQSFCEIKTPEADIFEHLFLLCIEEYQQENSQEIQMLNNCLFRKALRYTNENQQMTLHHSSKIRSALLYINTHFRASPSLNETARAISLNSSYLSSIFHKEMKISYSKYLTRLKIDYAKELLLSTDLSIEDICYECGFGSYPGFLQAFKKLTNTSPCKLRGKSSKKPTANSSIEMS